MSCLIQENQIPIALSNNNVCINEQYYEQNEKPYQRFNLQDNQSRFNFGYTTEYNQNKVSVRIHNFYRYISQYAKYQGLERTLLDISRENLTETEINDATQIEREDKRLASTEGQSRLGVLRCAESDTILSYSDKTHPYTKMLIYQYASLRSFGNLIQYLRNSISSMNLYIGNEQYENQNITINRALIALSSSIMRMMLVSDAKTSLHFNMIENLQEIELGKAFMGTVFNIMVLNDAVSSPIDDDQQRYLFESFLENAENIYNIMLKNIDAASLPIEEINGREESRLVYIDPAINPNQANDQLRDRYRNIYQQYNRQNINTLNTENSINSDKKKLLQQMIECNKIIIERLRTTKDQYAHAYIDRRQKAKQSLIQYLKNQHNQFKSQLSSNIFMRSLSCLIYYPLTMLWNIIVYPARYMYFLIARVDKIYKDKCEKDIIGLNLISNFLESKREIYFS